MQGSGTQFKRLCWFAGSSLLLIAILSYDASDPGLFHWVSHGGLIRNWVGLFGAYLADFVLNVFGVTGLLGVVFLCVDATRALLGRGVDVPPRVLLFFMAGIAPLCALYLPGFSMCPSGPGGVLGTWLAWHMLHALGHTGVWFLSLLLLINMLMHLRPSQPSAPSSNSIPKLKPKKKERLLEEFIEGTESLEQDLPERKTHAKPVVTQKTVGKKIDSEAFLPGTLPLHLLQLPQEMQLPKLDANEYRLLKELVEEKLDEFGIASEVVDIVRGPVITRMELNLAAGTKASRLTSISRDLARSMSIPSVRVVEVIPGKSCVGLELPNAVRQTVYLRELLSSDIYQKNTSPLTLALGKDISGAAVVVDLMKMPHLLVAGTTGSGKSVGVNTMLLSLLYKSSPEELRLILIDPKMLELAIYGDIPHLLTPVVTDMNDAAAALRWSVAEMERRYQMMAAVGVRNIQGYNQAIKELKERQGRLDELCMNEEYRELLAETPLEPLPYLVIVADEFADMMMVVGKKVEQLIARLAQKARAAGIHLILATQRPSVDVITGLIKANIPTRIAFQVSSKIDSRTILDQQGAEALLGSGDMLYLPPGMGSPIRVHGAFVRDSEVHEVVSHLKKLGRPQYIALTEHDVGTELARSSSGGDQDPLLEEAIVFVRQSRRVSISGIQRRFRIGYNRAANLVELMEQMRVVTEPDEQGVRKLLSGAD